MCQLRPRANIGVRSQPATVTTALAVQSLVVVKRSRFAASTDTLIIDRSTAFWHPSHGLHLPHPSSHILVSTPAGSGSTSCPSHATFVMHRFRCRLPPSRPSSHCPSLCVCVCVWSTDNVRLTG